MKKSNTYNRRSINPVIYIKMVLVLCLLVPVVSFGQSLYTEGINQSYYVGTGVYLSEDVNGLGVSLGTSFIGAVDIGMSIDRSIYGGDNQNMDLNSTGFGPYVGAILFKQDDIIPVSFRIGLAYQRKVYDGGALSFNNLSMYGNSFSMGMSVHLFASMSEKTGIMPSAGFSYIMGNATVETRDGYSESASAHDIGFRFSLPFVINPYTKTVVTLTPSLFFVDGSSAFSFNLGFILS